MRMKLLGYLVTALLLTTTGARAAETLSLGTWGTSSHPQVAEFTKPFMEAVQKQSNGAIKFKYFPDDQMVKQAFVPNAVPAGTVDISLATLDSWAGRIPEVSVTVTPLWTLSMQDTRDKLVPGNPVFEWFDKEFQKAGVKILTIFDIGPPVVSTDFPLAVPADIKGKKIRATSKGHAELLQKLNASPVVLSVGEVYQALQRGTVNGAVGGLQGMIGLKHYEVAKHLLVSNGVLGTYVHGYVMNLRRFNSLSKEHQDIIMKAAADARNKAQDVMIEGYENYLKVAEEKGMTVVRLKRGSPEWNDWLAAAESFTANQKKVFSPALLSALGH
jgi:TRAP-type C4-dicarboxylate transport system substrate-binding protein